MSSISLSFPLEFNSGLIKLCFLKPIHLAILGQEFYLSAF